MSASPAPPAGGAPDGPVLVTGAAGFVGNALALRLLDDGREVVGVDSLNDYYDVRLKEARLARLEGRRGWRFEKLDLAERGPCAGLFERHRPPVVAHLAAQAGVRYSLENPHAYARSNLVAFLNVLEGCRGHACAHLVYASSSSVYGANEAMPFRAADPADHPVSLYAATKRANELMAHSYSHLYGLPATGLRFFTVYGPWMRPDMVPFVFAERIDRGLPIKLFNGGRVERDFTFVDDIVEGLARVLDAPPPPGLPAGTRAGPDRAEAPWRVLNLGRGQSVALGRVVAALEEGLGVEAAKELLPMQPGDVRATWADVAPLRDLAGYEPRVSIEEGVAAFAGWYKDTWRPLRDA